MSQKRSVISLDYDNTFTRDMALWTQFVRAAEMQGHEVICVTMRHDNDGERIPDMPCRVVYTGRKAKLPFLKALDIKVDIWIDDSPHWIFQDG